MEQLPLFHPAGWIHLRFSGIHAILSRDRESLIALRACVARILNGGEKWGGEKGSWKIRAKCLPRCGLYGSTSIADGKVESRRKGRRVDGFFFFFLLPFPSTIPFYYFFSYSIPCKLRFSRVQSYSFYGRGEIQTITPKFFFFCATVERNVFWIIRFSTRQNNPRAVTHFVHTKVEEKSIATIYTVHAFKSNIEGTHPRAFIFNLEASLFLPSFNGSSYFSLPSPLLPAR